jgi:hypothetical protein
MLAHVYDWAAHSSDLFERRSMESEGCQKNFLGMNCFKCVFLAHVETTIAWWGRESARWQEIDLLGKR